MMLNNYHEQVMLVAWWMIAGSATNGGYTLSFACPPNLQLKWISFENLSHINFCFFIVEILC